MKNHDENELPGPPSKPQVTDVTKNSVSLSWQPGMAGASPVSSFVIEAFRFVIAVTFIPRSLQLVALVWYETWVGIQYFSLFFFVLIFNLFYMHYFVPPKCRNKILCSNLLLFDYSQSVSNSWQTVADHVKTTQFTVKGLRPNTIYLFMVRAVNSQGLSDPSPMSDPVRTQGNLH